MEPVAHRQADADVYRALFSATQEGLLVVDDKGRYVDVNDAYARLLKSAREAIVGHHFSEFMPPDRLSEAEQAFHDLLSSGRGLTEFPLRAADGTLVECEWTFHPHFLPGLSLCSARDITRRKLAEEALKASEARFRFLTTVDDATRPLTDPDQIVRTAARLLGEHLEADNVAYCRFEPDQERFQIIGEYRREDAPSILGQYQLSQFGAAASEALRNDRPYVVEDIETDPHTREVRPVYRQLGVGAHLTVPLHKAGRLVAAMSLQQRAPRKWRSNETELLRLVVNRCWESIERAHVESRLRRQSHTFDGILSNLPDLICTFDLDGHLTYANPALLQVWGKSLDEIVGKNTFELHYPSDLAERIQAEVRAVIGSRQRVRNRTPFTAAGGETRAYEYIFSPILGADGLVEAVTCTARDITERERMEQELARSQQRLEQVFAQAPVAIVVLKGRDLVIELANPFYQALVRGRLLAGQPLAQAIPELGRDVLDALYGVLDTGEPFTAAEWLIPYDQDGDGAIEDHWLNLVFHPFREADGQVSRVIAVCSDVTARVLVRKQLERANRELEEFAYVASHDLQEPLRMVAIYTQMLLSRNMRDDRTAQEYGGFVRQGVDRMEQLIRDLLAYSRIVHTDTATAGRADLNESLAAALKAVEGRIAETSAKVVAEQLPAVCGEASQLVHVFQNLLSNSLKYCAANRAPEIHISAERDGENWIVSIRDNGIGFDPQYSKRIFGLFKRLHKDEFAGTGLGLAICQRIVERYGGRIWAEGRPGQGATFHIALAAAE